MSRYLLLTAGALICAGMAMPAISAEPDTAAALAELEASLPGELINDPTSLDWKTQGEGLRTSNLSDADIPGGGAATLYNVRRAGANAWAVQVYVPLTGEIAAGEQVTMGFWARTAVPPAGSTAGKLSIRLQDNVEPWPGFGDTPLEIGTDWKWYEATAIATVDISRRNGTMVFQIGSEKQEIEIGQAIVVKGADRIIGNGARPPIALPPQLEGKGTLVSSPDSRDWTFLGPPGSSSQREDGTIWLDRAVQFTSPSVGANAWDIQASVPLTEDIRKGDRLLIAVAAKTVSAATEDGRALVGIRVQENREPFTAFAENRFKAGANWQLVQINTTATIDLPTGSGVVALHFAGVQQVVDIGPVYVLKLPPTRDGD